MCPNRQLPADLVTFTEEIFNGKLHFLCSESSIKDIWQGPKYTSEFQTLKFLLKYLFIRFCINYQF